MEEYLVKIQGTKVLAESLSLSKAKGVVLALSNNPYATLIECYTLENGNELVVFDAEVELAQVKIHDIRRFERIAVEFDATDTVAPYIMALRSTFPMVPHLLTGEKHLPRYLCMFEQPYTELKLHWNGTHLVEQIRGWLSKTARGELHADDQPLEPLLFHSHIDLILPQDFLQQGATALQIVQLANTDERKSIFAAHYLNNDFLPDQRNHILAWTIIAEAQSQGVIQRQPRTLHELDLFLQQANTNLLHILRGLLKQWEPNIKHLKDATMMIVLVLPKCRQGSIEIESYELRAFFLGLPLWQIGKDIGVTDNIDGAIGFLIAPDTSMTGESVPLLPLNPMLAFSPTTARYTSGLDIEQKQNFVMIGAGAIGSHFFINLARMGIGKQWTIIDHDSLLPHNLARHALFSGSVGSNKATSLAASANHLLNVQFASAIVDNVLTPKHADEINRVVESADVIVDMAASIPVSRYLAHDVKSDARRISAFLNPTGTALIFLAEDGNRKLSLADLEMQYYQFLLHEPKLAKHLARQEGRLRYAATCRDISAIIPQDNVALFSGVASKLLRRVIAHDEAVIEVWQESADGVDLERYEIPVSSTQKIQFTDWTLFVSENLLERANLAREDRLPNETGGILIGAYDRTRRHIYVVDTILSPPDSVEWPTSYIRGHAGLIEKLERIQQITDSQLQYIGEWHSHPDGVGCRPSQLDVRAFGWLATNMVLDESPALMLIVGDSGQYRFFLEEMSI